MKMSKREKIMLLILAAVIILVGSYYFIIEPQFRKITDLKVKRDDLSNIVDQIQLEIATTNIIDKNYDELYQKTGELTKRFYPYILQDRILLLLDSLIKNTENPTNTIGFSGISIVDVTIENDEVTELFVLNDIAESFKKLNNQGYIENSDTPDGIQPYVEEPIINPLQSMSVTMQFKSSFEKIMSFIEAVEDLNRTILFASLSVNSGDEEDLTGSIQLDFYAVPKIHEQDEEYLNWPFDNVYGRENPFDEFSGYVPPVVIEEEE